jgi:hypothetical protein
MKNFLQYMISEGSTMHPANIGGEGDVGGGFHTGGNKKALRRTNKNKKKKSPPEEVEVNPTMEAHRVRNKQNVPVYVPIPGKKGFHKVVGHVRRNATSVGAAKVAKSRSAFKTMKLVSPEYPEGPGWIAVKK